ncbi:hypothetical protein [Bacillus cabrialesii]|uniref:CGNR zinc finger domain-containing protein n=1 Tax=Bacillus cabrialesii subsp. tritici TaxID=2944916 RepID=A0ABT9DGX6_9BACI|nr:hypothetical protein [Bacillus cabrialesii]MDO8223940.1 hypothetical protein [Bacillus cabrialesii subsp. tritici]
MIEKFHYWLDAEEDSFYLTASIQEINENNINELKIEGANAWLESLGKTSEKFVTTLPYKHIRRTFNPKGLACEFSKLKTENDINNFANIYGLLGISTPDQAHIGKIKFTKSVFSDSSHFIDLPIGQSYCEPIELWFFHIKEMQKLLKLYQVLINIHKGDLQESFIEDSLLSLSKPIGGSCQILWWDGSWTGLTAHEDELAKEYSFLKLAQGILAHKVNSIGNQDIKRFPETIITGKPPLGFTIKECKYTSYLIRAIYYDLWQLISNNEPVHICENQSCKLPFKKVKRQKYCSNACKQEAYRLRKKSKMK